MDIGPMSVALPILPEKSKFSISLAKCKALNNTNESLFHKWSCSMDESGRSLRTRSCSIITQDTNQTSPLQESQDRESSSKTLLNTDDLDCLSEASSSRSHTSDPASTNQWRTTHKTTLLSCCVVFTIVLAGTITFTQYNNISPSCSKGMSQYLSAYTAALPKRPNQRMQRAYPLERTSSTGVDATIRPQTNIHSVSSDSNLQPNEQNNPKQPIKKTLREKLDRSLGWAWLA